MRSGRNRSHTPALPPASSVTRMAAHAGPQTARSISGEFERRCGNGHADRRGRLWQPDRPADRQAERKEERELVPLHPRWWTFVHSVPRPVRQPVGWCPRAGGERDNRGQRWCFTGQQPVERCGRRAVSAASSGARRRRLLRQTVGRDPLWCSFECRRTPPSLTQAGAAASST